MAYPTGFEKTRAGTLSAHPVYVCRLGKMGPEDWTGTDRNHGKFPVSASPGLSQLTADINQVTFELLEPLVSATHVCTFTSGCLRESTAACVIGKGGTLGFAIVLACILVSVSFVWTLSSGGRRNRFQSVAKQLDPLGFTISKSFEPEDRNRFYSFLNDGLWMVHSPFFVAVLENDGVRIVAAEFSVGKHERIFYIMGSTKEIEVPSMIIRRNTAGSKFMGIANLDAVWFAEDQEFQERYVVRGKKKDEIRAFLTPQRRRAILDEPRFFMGLGISGDSILIEYNRRFREETFAEETDKCVAMTRVVAGMCQRGSRS